MSRPGDSPSFNSGLNSAPYDLCVCVCVCVCVCNLPSCLLRRAAPRRLRARLPSMAMDMAAATAITAIAHPISPA